MAKEQAAKAAPALVRIIETSGAERVETVDRENVFQTLYPVLACRTIELVELSQDRLLLCDEEGRLTGRAFNPKATELAGRFIVGTVAVMLSEDLA